MFARDIYFIHSTKKSSSEVLRYNCYIFNKLLNFIQRKCIYSLKRKKQIVYNNTKNFRLVVVLSWLISTTRKKNIQAYINFIIQQVLVFFLEYLLTFGAILLRKIVFSVNCFHIIIIATRFCFCYKCLCIFVFFLCSVAELEYYYLLLIYF